MSATSIEAVRNAPPVRDRRYARIAAAATACSLVVLGAYHLLLTASTVAAYMLRYPFMDQLRCNLRYLTLPFPQNVLALENGHRPILPGIVRVADLKWFDGFPVVQPTTAWLAGGIAVALLIREIHRGLRGNALLQAAGFCIVVTLIAWNANARLFIHPHENPHAFYPLFFAVAAIMLVLHARPPTRSSAWAMAIAFCVAATFSFGVGIASFGALLAVAILRRCKIALAVSIVAAAIATLLVYYWVLPGAAGVQGNVTVAPATLFFVVARAGAVFAELVRLRDATPSSMVAIAWSTGAIGFALIVTSVIGRWIRSDDFSDLEIVGVAVFVFGFAANAVIAVSRTGYFFEYPGQLFADRYIFWSCVAWAGLALYGLARLARSHSAPQYAAALATGALSYLAIAPATWANQWSAAVYRSLELVAVAERLGIRNDEQLAFISDEGPANAARSFDEMRKQRLAMFAERSTLQSGDKVSIAMPQATVEVAAENVVMQGNGGKAVRRLSGALPTPLASKGRASQLWFVASDGTVIGRGAVTAGTPRNRFSLGSPRWAWLEGYLTQPTGSDIAMVAVADGTLTPLARVQLRK